MKRLLSMLLILVLLLCGCQLADPGPAEPDELVSSPEDVLKDAEIPAEGFENTVEVDPAAPGEEAAPSVTPEMKAAYYAFAKKYMVHMLPNFAEGESISLTDAAVYAAAMGNLKEIEEEMDGSKYYVSARAVKQVSENYLSATFDLTDSEWLEVSETVDFSYPYCRLAAYQKEGDRITVKLLNYHLIKGMDPENALFNEVNQRVEEIAEEQQISYAAAADRLILSEEEIARQASVIHLTYLAKEDGSPERFLSCFIADGANHYPEVAEPEIREQVDPMELGAAEDPAITSEQRKFYQEFASKYRLYELKGLTDDEVWYRSGIEQYAVNLYPEEIIPNDDFSPRFPAAIAKKVSEELFAMDYEIQEETYVAYVMKSDPVFYELAAYRATPQPDGTQKIEIKLKIYNCHLPEEDWSSTAEEIPAAAHYPTRTAIYDIMRRDGLSYYQAAEKLVVELGSAPEPADHILHFSYLTADGTTPTQFLRLDEEYYNRYTASYEGVR